MLDVLSMLKAKDAGLTRYFTGKACPRGHIAERMVSTRACSQCLAEKKSAWSANNPEKVNAQKRGWRDANIEKARAQNLVNQKLHRSAANVRNRRYMAAHPEKMKANYQARDKETEKARLKAWRDANPDKLAAIAAKRRALKLRRTPVWANHEEIKKVYKLAAKFRRLGCDFHVDHVIPLCGKFVSGLHVHNNLEIIEAEANRSKSNHF